MLEKFKKKFSKYSKKIARVQTKILLTLFYFTIVSITFLYLQIVRKKLHEKTGFWTPREKIKHDIEEQKKQYN